MKSCSKNHLEVTWDEKECSCCPTCCLKGSQDHLRGEVEKYKLAFEALKSKYEPQIRARDLSCSDFKEGRYKQYAEEEVINGLFFYDWTLNGISTKRKPIDYSRKGSIVS